MFSCHLPVWPSIYFYILYIYRCIFLCFSLYLFVVLPFRPEGHDDIVDARKWMKDTIPEFNVDPGPFTEEQYCTVAVLCRADYKKAHSVNCLNHWVPALKSEQVGHSHLARDEWRNEAKEAWQQKIEALETRHLQADDADPIVKKSIEHEVAVLKRQLNNFLAMQDELFEQRGLLVRHVQGDGNCGVYMMLSLIQDIPMHEVAESEAMKLRRDLQTLWIQLRSNPVYQKVWKTLRDFGSGPDEGEGSQPGKPQQSKDPFTPDRARKKRLLPANGVWAIHNWEMLCKALGLSMWLNFVVLVAEATLLTMR